MNALPRNAIEKSMTYKYRNENEENLPTWKKYSTNVPATREYGSLIKDELKRAYQPNTNQDIILKKLEGPSNQEKNGWNASKLDSIQNRIQSVLKQINKWSWIIDVSKILYHWPILLWLNLLFLALGFGSYWSSSGLLRSFPWCFMIDLISGR